MKNICIITGGFPTPKEPGKYAFVEQLACAWADMGIDVSVIYPIPTFVELFDKNRFYQSRWKKKTIQNNEISVFCPRFFSASNMKIAGVDTRRISYKSFQRAIRRTIKHANLEPDVLYGHFLPYGCQAGSAGKALGIPAFCAFGESSLWSIEGEDKGFIQSQLELLTGIISVSTENKRILIDNQLFREKDIEVFPNGADHDLFHRGNKEKLREKYGLPPKVVIGAFTGSFNESKGVLRAQRAAIDAGNTKMIFIGGGSEKPIGDNIVFCGKLQHELIPEYLSMADFFILPTQAEGCCNAIVEAMSCGLPIISSTGAYNDDILSDEYAIRTEPNDVTALTVAIKTLKDNPELRESMAVSAEKVSSRFDVYNRAGAIIEFMKRKIENR